MSPARRANRMPHVQRLQRRKQLNTEEGRTLVVSCDLGFLGSLAGVIDDRYLIVIDFGPVAVFAAITSKS